MPKHVPVIDLTAAAGDADKGTGLRTAHRKGQASRRPRRTMDDASQAAVLAAAAAAGASAAGYISSVVAEFFREDVCKAVIDESSSSSNSFWKDFFTSRILHESDGGNCDWEFSKAPHPNGLKLKSEDEVKGHAQNNTRRSCAQATTNGLSRARPKIPRRHRGTARPIKKLTPMSSASSCADDSGRMPTNNGIDDGASFSTVRKSPVKARQRCPTKRRNASSTGAQSGSRSACKRKPTVVGNTPGTTFKKTRDGHLEKERARAWKSVVTPKSQAALFQAARTDMMRRRAEAAIAAAKVATLIAASSRRGSRKKEFAIDEKQMNFWHNWDISGNLYTCLGLDEQQLSSRRELRQQYHRLAVLVHPDKCRHRFADSAFQSITMAYKALLSKHSWAL